MNEEWSRLKRSIGLANTTSAPANAEALKESLKRAARETMDRCHVERTRARALETPKDLSDEAVLEAARWTDRLPLSDYEGVLNLVPRLVNVVTVCWPHSNSFAHACSASRPYCTGSSPKRCPSPAPASSCRSTCTPSARAAATRTLHHAASPPSSSPSTARGAASSSFVSARQSQTRETHSLTDAVRVLRRHWTTCRHRCVALSFKPCSCIHSTDGPTGCAGPMAARLSIMRAARQLAIEADVHLHVRNFSVINQARTCSLNPPPARWHSQL